MYIDLLTRKTIENANLLSCDNNPRNFSALDHDEDEQYVLTPKLAVRAAPTLFETKLVQSAISSNIFGTRSLNSIQGQIKKIQEQCFILTTLPYSTEILGRSYNIWLFNNLSKTSYWFLFKGWSKYIYCSQYFRSQSTWTKFKNCISVGNWLVCWCINCIIWLTVLHSNSIWSLFFNFFVHTKDHYIPTEFL